MPEPATESAAQPAAHQRLASALVFPLLMCGALGTTWALLQTHIAAPLAVFAVLVPSALSIAVLERALPYRASWLRSHQDFGTDLVHMLLTQIVIPRVLGPLWPALLVGATAALAARFGAALWPHELPLPLQLALVLVIAEFGRYWIHRAAHESALLWRLHAVHHSSERLYWLNAGRFHPLEKVLFLIPEVVPFVLLGTNEQALSMYFVFNGVHGLFQHANIRVTLGPLNYIFSMSELHRWHHSRLIEESNSNYGNNLILWDLVFGTYLNPSDRQIGSIGLLSESYPARYLGQLMAPFRRERLDKPHDFWDRPEHYEAQIRQSNQAINERLNRGESC